MEGVKRRRLVTEESSSAATNSTISERASESPGKLSDRTVIDGLGFEAKDASVFDLDLLDCTICTEHLASPIYQCQNGHVACASCSKKTSNVCPSCQQPTGSIRCLVLEKLIESLKVKCKFADSGCTATVKFSEKASHERTCVFEPLSCPFPGCYFRDNPLLSRFKYNRFQEHVREIHPGSWGVHDANSTNFFMHPKDKFHIVFGNDLCFAVCRNRIGTVGIGRFGHSVGDMCYLTVLKVLSDRFAKQTSFPYMMKLKTVSNVVGGASSTFTIEADCCIDEPEVSPRDDGFVVVAEANSVEILDVVFLPPRPPTTSALDLLVAQR